ncbi:hypothetical protein FOA43_001354 [Brettanomyces nanus]|uniref:Uncharacterized protein n=1 Tax=Eeniella nana TaxID=13502 RepID=A0A875S126_EENNA|nr:uncharacterized protein FOA43_001354 [Brettanomyces nanus]QPG74035.1 hypothetical protein FOA43_001354 [Brettanomyces nanus]
MYFHLVALAFIFASLAAADVTISAPASSETVTASSGDVKVKIEWADDDSSPELTDATAYTFKLCTGSNTDIEGVDEIDTISASAISGYSYTASFDASDYASGLYYVQIYTTFKSGAYSIHYSSRFSVKGLTGSTKASGSGDPPTAETSSPDAAVNSKSFSITYTLQTGKTRYAPMQMQPGSTVTVSSWSRRFPTSAVTYYSTYRKSLDCLSTITPGWSYTMDSFTNMATPAPFPSEVGWYPASQKLESASLDGSLRRIKKRRWDD